MTKEREQGATQWRGRLSCSGGGGGGGGGGGVVSSRWKDLKGKGAKKSHVEGNNAAASEYGP